MNRIKISRFTIDIEIIEEKSIKVLQEVISEMTATFREFIDIYYKENKYRLNRDEMNFHADILYIEIQILNDDGMKNAL